MTYFGYEVLRAATSNPEDGSYIAYSSETLVITYKAT
jgi:hypothetical protein